MEALHLKYVSIYWLYLSAYYYTELPLEPFYAPFNDKNRPEMKRIKDLIMLSFKASTGNKDIYERYCNRWNKVVQRNKDKIDT